jgi:hypothetical protein
MTAKRSFAACDKLTLMVSGTQPVAQGELHVIGYFRHTQTAILSPE